MNKRLLRNDYNGTQGPRNNYMKAECLQTKWIQALFGMGPVGVWPYNGR